MGTSNARTTHTYLYEQVLLFRTKSNIMANDKNRLQVHFLVAYTHHGAIYNYFINFNAPLRERQTILFMCRYLRIF